MIFYYSKSCSFLILNRKLNVLFKNWEFYGRYRMIYQKELIWWPLVLKVFLWCVLFYKNWENDVHFSYHRSNINGPGTPRPLNRPKIPLSVPMTTNGLPESTDSKESKQNEDKNHRFVCDLFLKTNVFPKKWHLWMIFLLKKNKIYLLFTVVLRRRKYFNALKKGISICWWWVEKRLNCLFGKILFIIGC